MLTINSPKLAYKFSCEICNYKCSKESDYKKHLSTRKHNNTYMNLQNMHEQSSKRYMCSSCNKGYTFRQSLYNHKKKCVKPLNNNEEISIPLTDEEKPDIVELLINENKEFKNVIIELFKNNSDLQKQMLEVCQKSNNTVNNHNNSHNKTFNLNFFLNEQCKDAMNIMDFVNTFHRQFSDLERIGEVGYVEGISNLIIDKLNKMDIYKRPIHCSDAKREIMHIKDNDVWEKDNENNDKLRLAIKHITKKNIDLIGDWTEKYPGVRYSDHRLNDKFNEIIMEAMGGKNNKTMKEGEGKIIKKISKMVLIDKHM